MLEHPLSFLALAALCIVPGVFSMLALSSWSDLVVVVVADSHDY